MSAHELVGGSCFKYHPEALAFLAERPGDRVTAYRKTAPVDPEERKPMSKTTRMVLAAIVTALLVLALAALGDLCHRAGFYGVMMACGALSLGALVAGGVVVSVEGEG